VELVKSRKRKPRRRPNDELLAPRR
jgi:hypothetical protein